MGHFVKIPIKRNLDKQFKINNEIKYQPPTLEHMSAMAKIPMSTGLRLTAFLCRVMYVMPDARKTIMALKKGKSKRDAFDNVSKEDLHNIWQGVGEILNAAPLDVYEKYMKELDTLLTAIAKSRRFI